MRDPNSGCWLWGGDTNGKYGSLMLRVNGKSIRRYAHRLVYERYIGVIPAGMEIDHKCRTPMCVNPDHLRCISHLENNRSKPFHLRGSRSRPKSTHCKNGHDLSTNRYLCKRDPDKGGDYFSCRTCRKAAWDRGNRLKSPMRRLAITLSMKISCVFIRAVVPCGICNERLTEKDEIEWDHIHAIVHGGPHVPENLRPVHAECHKVKTKADIQAKFKINRLKDPRPSKRPMKNSGKKIPSRPFRRPPPKP